MNDAAPATRSRSTINPPVFFAAGGLLVALITFSVVYTRRATAFFATALDTISTHFGWLYVASVAFFIVLSIWLGFGRFASIRLGADDERPAYSTGSWFAMLFSAGMGIGLVFYGVAEPVLHYQTPPTGPGETLAARKAALPLAMFHWGVHAWAIYALMGLSIAYFAHRKGLPLALRSCLYPLFGDRIYGLIGHVVDVIAVFGTLFGLATSLGLGAMQMSAGLHFVFGTPHTLGAQLVLIGVVTACATVSLVTGVDKGIRRLSEANLILAASLMAFVFVVGPTLPILDSLVESTGGYVRLVINRTFAVGALDEEAKEWAKSWTLFYWGWWIAWAPFVGMFVARISKGRTIRELVLGVLLVPTAVSVLWFGVFGGTALHLDAHGAGIAEAVSNDVSTAIYVTLEHLPLASVTSGLAAAVVAVFFITSSDSASFVVDMLTSGGHPNPPMWQRIFWATAEGACAAVLLYAGGKAALTALQAAVISIALPFCIVLLAMAYCLVKALREEAAPARQ